MDRRKDNKSRTHTHRAAARVAVCAVLCGIHSGVGGAIGEGEEFLRGISQHIV